MTFNSILFNKFEDSLGIESSEEPSFFVDLNLDQVVNAITAGRQEYNLKPFYYTPLNDPASITYRHEVMQDLQNAALFETIKSFSREMRNVRQRLSLVHKLDYRYHKEGWFLNAVETYSDAVDCLARDLAVAELKSQGLSAFRWYLADYLESGRYASLVSQVKKLKAELSKVKYCLIIDGNNVTIRNYKSEIDYSMEVERTFEKFKRGAEKDYRVEFRDDAGMNHVEAKILDSVANLYPDVFSQLVGFFAENGSFLDKTIVTFDREIQFYMAYLDYVAAVSEAGLKFCYPRISRARKDVCDHECFDLALACRLIKQGTSVVCNDFYLKDNERIFVVSGPNQGGKTTFARTFGQLHYLASLGCPVPGREARLFLFDSLFTYFEKEENIENLRGKLQDDLVRIHSILSRATSDSIIIMNEIFSSTTLDDAIFLSKKVMEKLQRLDLLCVYVTFIDELASLSEKTVSIVSTTIPEDPAIRTFKIVRKPADGLSYALSIAEKHRLTYGYLKERLGS